MYKRYIFIVFTSALIYSGIFSSRIVSAEEPFLPDNPLKGARVFAQKKDARDYP